MSESEITSEPKSEQESLPPPPTMEAQSPTKLDKPGGISFSIWPPTLRTRDAIINRLIETLSKPSVLSKRYGTIPSDEASTAARKIEEEAFAAAGGSAAADSDGIEILQVYSKEISKLMLDAVKARAPAASAVDNSATQTPASDTLPSPATDGNAAAESVSSS